MAEKRMFAKTIIDSDAFLDMPVSARLLYYDLGMRADDDGFVNNPKKIMRMIGVSDEDIRILVSQKFIIPFESGVIVIKHWRINNYLRTDRYQPTKYQKERSELEIEENNSYKSVTCGSGIPVGIPVVYQRYTQSRIDKIRLDKDRVDICRDDIVSVFDFWKKTLKHEKAVLDKKREKCISKALELGYSIEDLQKAVAGCSKTAFNMGANDQRKKYDEVSLIFRDSDHIERFMSNSNGPDLIDQYAKLADELGNGVIDE